MFSSRRKFIKSLISITGYSLAVSSGMLHSGIANAQWLKASFLARSYDETLKHLFNEVEFIDSYKIKFKRLPWVAENGAIVPIKIISSIKNVTKISILVDKNPHPLIAEFYLSAAVEPQVSARIKMAETSQVIVIVEADGKYYRKTQKVKVTVGGCG